MDPDREGHAWHMPGTCPTQGQSGAGSMAWCPGAAGTAGKNGAPGAAGAAGPPGAPALLQHCLAILLLYRNAKTQLPGGCDFGVKLGALVKWMLLL